MAKGMVGKAKHEKRYITKDGVEVVIGYIVCWIISWIVK